MNRLNLLFSSYIFVIVGLFLYSFTQVDLSLTLSRNAFIHSLEKSIQHVGYFNRPLSTLVFLVIIALLTTHYLIFVYLALKNKINTTQIWILIIGTTAILTLSYNAFSYDLFNYIFDAKLITFYHVNPYQYRALDFPREPMLSFMHWSHRTYPYGPFWLVMTVPFSFLGLNLFIPTLFIFKALISATFLATVYLIQKIAREINPKREKFILVTFALSPFVLIEAVLDSHNDMPMMMFAVLSIYLALKKRWLLSVIAVILSALTKQATVFMVIPVILYVVSEVFKKRIISFENFLKFCILSMTIALIYVVSRIDIQPWYFLWVFPLIILLKPNKYIFLTVTGFSIGLLLRYSPFLYRGDWNGLVPTIELYATIFSTLIGFLSALILDIYRLSKQKA